MANIPSNLLGFVIVLGFLVFAHESGHFLMAKLFRVRVFVFSFGFGKRLFGFRRGDTDYRVSLIPLGGYVRMAGETPEEEREGGEYEFLSKPKWQRFLILFAGPGVNVIVAIALLVILNMIGMKVVREQNFTIGVVSGKPAIQAGLRRGDVIESINGEAVRTFDDFRLLVSMNPQKPVTVKYLRDGIIHTTTLTPERYVSEYGVIGRAGVGQWMAAEVGDVEPQSPAGRAGLQPGDRILSADGKNVESLDEFMSILNATKGTRPVPMQIARANRSVDLVLPPIKSQQEFYPGFGPPSVFRQLGFRDAFNESIDQNVKMLRFTVATLKRLFTGRGSLQDFGGPLKIAQVSGEMLRLGWRAMVILMASVSLQLALLNLFPIPGLDGGHIMILLVEGVAGRELSLMAKERIMRVGFAVIATLMLFVIGNDVFQTVAEKFFSNPH